MILGMPTNTFMWLIAMPAVCLIVSIIYGITFKDDGGDTWWTIEDLFAGKKQDNATKEDTAHGR